MIRKRRIGETKCGGKATEVIRRSLKATDFKKRF